MLDWMPMVKGKGISVSKKNGGLGLHIGRPFGDALLIP